MNSHSIEQADNEVIDLVSGMLDRLNDLEYGGIKLSLRFPFEITQIPRIKQISYAQILEFFHPYGILVEEDKGRTADVITYKFYKMNCL